MALITRQNLSKGSLVMIMFLLCLDYSSFTKGFPRFESVFEANRESLPVLTGIIFSISDFSKTPLGGLPFIGLIILCAWFMRKDFLNIVNPKYPFFVFIIYF